ncbi:MAG: sulfatase [Aureliella sp.]
MKNPSVLLCSFILWGYVLDTLAAQDKRPDIVFIIVDDLNDWVGCLGGHPDAKSPNIDALAASGMLFSQAYCNSPQCRPSRTSLNCGLYPFRTGTYFNARYRGESKIESPTMQQFFMQHGYRVCSGGKVFHGNPGKHGDVLLKQPRDPKPPKGEDNFDAMRAPNDGYALDVSDEEMGDYKVATWASEQWNQVTEKPLFMSVGFFRPHRPLQVPIPWFEQFPLASIRRPDEPKGIDDWDDLPTFAQRLARSHAHKPLHQGVGGELQSDHEFIVANSEWDATIRAYQASIAFVDCQIGRFLESLALNPRGRETYIMLVSDHGWHLGEKKHWCKGAIWEQTTHIPFIVNGPKVEAGSKCDQPVSLIDVYPSLVDFAGLEVPSWLDGVSVKPQLLNPNATRGPAISSYGGGNTSVRTQHWRYIRYEDGSEELYDHRVDSNEWTNLASDPVHQKIKQSLADMIPSDQHEGLKVQDWFDKYQK